MNPLGKKCPGNDCGKPIPPEKKFCPECEKKSSPHSSHKQNFFPSIVIPSSKSSISSSLSSTQIHLFPTKITNFSSYSTSINTQNSPSNHNSSSSLPPISSAYFYKGGSVDTKSNINQPQKNTQCFVYAPLAADEMCGAKYEQSEIEEKVNALFSKIGGGDTGKGDKTFAAMGFDSLTVNTAYQKKWKKMVKYAMEHNVRVCLGITWKNKTLAITGQHVIYAIGYIENDLYARDQQNQHSKIVLSMNNWKCKEYIIYKFGKPAFRECTADFISFGGSFNNITELEILKLN